MENRISLKVLAQQILTKPNGMEHDGGTPLEHPVRGWNNGGARCSTMPPQCSTVPPPIGWNTEQSLEERVRFAHSDEELEQLLDEIRAGFEAGRLSQAESERLNWLLRETSRQLRRGLVNVPVGSHD